MSTTNHTVNYELSQYIGSDATSYLANYNSDMYKIDAQMKNNADDASEAKSDAATAVAISTTAASNASAAVSTANAANTAAEAAQTSATAAQTAAGAAQTDAAAALRASASNPIGNLAPAYDSTLTYAVGDLVTYVDTETNQGKLYKCIVAIVTPEEFNINKWDDITTSQVFGRKSRVIASHTVGATSEVWKDILDDLFTEADSVRDFNKETILLIKKSTGTEYYHQRVNDATSLQYFNFNISAPGVNTADIKNFILSADSSVRTANFTAGNLTTTDTSSDIITNAVLEIIELDTV